MKIVILLLLLIILYYLILPSYENFNNMNNKKKYDNIIIIPYRNRPDQLNNYIDVTYKIINNYLPNTFFLIVEQSEEKAFNRGKLINVGFKEFGGLCYYIITHDIDIIPKKSTVMEIYSKKKKNKIIGIYTSECDTLGGIVKIPNNIYKKINGFPNNYWGWGAEDKALQNRSEYYDINIEKNIKSNSPYKNNYFDFLKDTNDRKKINLNEKTKFEYNIFKKLSYTDKKKIIQNDGLSNLNYILKKKIKIKNNFYHIIVSI